MAQHKPLKLGCLALALAGLVTVLVAFTASAGADPYGELGTPFGKAHEAEEIKAGEINFQGVHAFAVDPTDDSMYVGDETEPEINTKGEEFKHYRIQKFSASGQPLASASFKLAEHEHAVTLAGIAVDPSLKRVYMLVADEREKEPDSSVQAAGALYGFSTEPKGEALEPVVNEVTKKPPLVGEALFKPQGAKAREALLKPGGIAVDPTTHDVIITGIEDENEEEELRAAVVRVAPSGALGNRSVDSTNCLLGLQTSGGEPACATAGGEPISPVVDQSGKVYVRVAGGVGGMSEIWQIPTPESEKLPNGEFKTIPKQLFAQPVSKGVHLVTFGFAGEGEGEEPRGSSMSLVPEGEREGKLVGRIYANAEIQQDEEEKGHLKGGTGFTFPGALVFGYTENKATGVLEAVSEEGWIGGPSTGPKCEIEAPGSVTALVGGGKEQDVFVFAFGEGKEERGEVFPPVARVSKFGPGGEGCPHARLTNSGVGGITATAAAGEKAVFSPKDEVVFSSEVFQADAVGARWEFENVTTHEKQEYSSGKEEFQSTAVPPRRFEKEGEYKVRETIRTDDFASPEIQAERAIKVEGRPTVRITGPFIVSVGASAALKGTFTNPNGGSLKYAWSFGDGAETSPASTAGGEVNTSHAYGAAGSYTVTLTVTDEFGFTGKATFGVRVAEPEQPPPTTSSPTPSPPPPGQTTRPSGDGGVLSYSASFAGTTLSVSPKGVLVIKVNCGGQSSCKGTVTLRTVSAVSASSHKHKAILTLASGSFAVAGGHMAAVTLHLSTKARALLIRSHVLRARATIVGHDTTGASHTTQAVVTLRAAATHRKKH